MSRFKFQQNIKIKPQGPGADFLFEILRPFLTSHGLKGELANGV